MCKRDNSHFICYVVISPEAETVLILVHSITLIPLDIIILEYLVGMKRRISRHVTCKIANSYFLG